MLASTLVSSAALLLAATNGSREGALNRFRQGHAHVRYSYGSCDSSSMDCSCFIQNLYLQVFRQQIPRTTLTQEQWLRPHRVSDIKLPRDLSENSLCPGDLIYTFQGKSWQEGPRHVAVYQGGGRILHSSRSRGGVGADATGWLRKFRLKGVYRPLGCETGESRSQGPLLPSRAVELASADDRAVRRLIRSYFRSLETRNLGDYQRLWAPTGKRWSEGRILSLPEILRERRAQLRGLKQASVHYEIESFAVFRDQAFVEVRVSRALQYNLHRRQEDGSQESFLVEKQQGRWRIHYNDDSAGN